MRILSGITPSSTKGLHLGNYFGMIKRFVALQETGECFYMVANLHALNTVHSAEEIRKNTENIFLQYLAFGIDPEKSVFFVESDVPEIPYLQTILNNVVTVAELKRMHGYKDKLAKDASPDELSAGLFEYPVLMAADILLFDIDTVPVGEDQTQHVEIAREMARTFNNRYGNMLKIPEVKVEKQSARIAGTDGVRKMSKSLGNDLPIFADEKEIFKQIMGITTDPARIHPTDPGDPSKNVCFSYLRLLGFDEERLTEYEERYRSGTVGDVEIKKVLYEAFLQYFKPHRARKAELGSDIGALQRYRQMGGIKAREVATSTIQKIKVVCGLE
ncbi:tryptophan--tRNA ligase [Candidatus Woesebacteria bacterium]|nr:tryptophan--tRNA ligase [Candidatus Woesebacteria bacterium]